MKNIEELIQIALDNKENSYSPYSNFRVSAVVMTKNGEIYKGVNIENASYPATICAERSALAAAISEGARDFHTIVITGDSKDTYPCGVCRQFMAEVLNTDTKVVIANSPTDYKTYSMEDLLPHSFSKKDLL